MMEGYDTRPRRQEPQAIEALADSEALAELETFIADEWLDDNNEPLSAEDVTIAAHRMLQLRKDVAAMINQTADMETME